MRASFQGQNIFALGNGIAKLQTPPLVVEEKPKKKDRPVPNAEDDQKIPQ